MKRKRIEREKKAAHDYINRRRAEATAVKISGEEWGKQVVFQTLDAVTTVARVADKLPNISLQVRFDTAGNTAYTDFKRVHIGIDMRATDVDEDKSLLPSREDSRPKLADKIATLKGMAYHEIGHIKYTVRPWDLFDDKSEQRMYHRTWNVLEDQRMESWSVKHNERLRSLFTIMVSNLILSRSADVGGNDWILIAGREYLPLEVQGAAYNSSPWSEDMREEWYQIVQRYKRATTKDAMKDAIRDAYDFLKDNTPGGEPLNGGIDDHAFDKEGDQQGQVSPDMGQGDEGEQGDDDKESPGKKAGKNSKLQVTDQSLFDAVMKAKHEAVEEFAKRGDVSTVVSRVNDAASSSVLSPPPDTLWSPMEPHIQAESEVLAEGMKRALSSFLTKTDPYWENRREVGVVDALAYRTKDPGSRDFRRQRIDFDGKGRNVHVSLLCDISGSMHGEAMVALSMALYATAKACEEMGVGNTMILWSTVYHQLWANGDVTPVVWNSCGGTDPIPALDTLDMHNEEEADNHLVLVFTDGQWFGMDPLTTWGAPGRKIVVLHYGRYTNVDSLGADEELRIENVTMIPELLAQYIGDLIISGE